MECPMPQPNDLRRSLLAGEARRLAFQRRHAFDSAGGRPREAEERSAPTLDQRERFTRDDIRLGGLGKREEKVLRGKPR
jgi:hypothetical protein